MGREIFDGCLSSGVRVPRETRVSAESLVTIDAPECGWSQADITKIAGSFTLHDAKAVRSTPF